MKGKGTIRVTVDAEVPAPMERLQELYLDYRGWPRLFPATIRGVRLIEQHADSMTVEVDHRTEGRVINIIRPRPPNCVELEEFKPRFVATFLNCFTETREGTRYVVTASVQIRGPLAVLAPLLTPLVRYRVRRYVIEPIRDAARGLRHQAG